MGSFIHISKIIFSLMVLIWKIERSTILERRLYYCHILTCRNFDIIIKRNKIFVVVALLLGIGEFGLKSIRQLVPKFTMVTLRAHYEPLNSNWSLKCECIVEILFFSCKCLCLVTFRIRRKRWLVFLRDLELLNVV